VVLVSSLSFLASRYSTITMDLVSFHFRPSVASASFSKPRPRVQVQVHVPSPQCHPPARPFDLS
jgi:hypothetical protein